MRLDGRAQPFARWGGRSLSYFQQKATRVGRNLTPLVRRTERQNLGSVLAQPVALVAPVRAVPLDERPEPPRMVRDAQVAELLHDHVVEAPRAAPAQAAS